MDIIQKLSAIFEQFPGIGPRQAKRFVFSILEKNESFAENLSSLVLELKRKIKQCPLCFYSFESNKNLTDIKCWYCRDLSRNQNIIMVLQKEIDLENIEKSKCYNGKYFILGGTISLLNKQDSKKLRMRELFDAINANKEIKEIVIAMNTDKEGEATALYIEKILEPFREKRGVKISRFAKGMSSGAEIEYADKDTLQNAFLNRN